MRGACRVGLAVFLLAAPAQAQRPARHQAPDTITPPAAAQVQRQHDGRTQAALRRVLGVLMQQYGDLTGKVPEGLNDGDLAMREAARALDAGDDKAAAAAIQKAIEALQKGGRSMRQQLAQQFGSQGQDGDEDGDGQMDADQDGGQPGDQDGNGPGGPRGRNDSGGRDGRRQAGRDADDQRDPLGRPLREDGHGENSAESGVKVPEQREAARSHAIQEELRRRSGEKTRPQPELDYIDRLLKQF